MYIPATQMTTPLLLQYPTKTEKVLGVNTKKSFADGIIFMANFKSYGGTEKVIDGIYEIDDTADVVCWYNPSIKADCRIKRLTDNAVYEIINEPENIEQRFQFLKFKVRRIKGGV